MIYITTRYRFVQGQVRRMVEDTRMLHIRMPDALIRQVDDYAAEQGISRTRFMVEAAEEHLRRARAARSLMTSYGALKDDRGEWATAESAAEWLDRIRHGDERTHPWPT